MLDRGEFIRLAKSIFYSEGAYIGSTHYVKLDVIINILNDYVEDNGNIQAVLEKDGPRRSLNFEAQE